MQERIFRAVVRIEGLLKEESPYIRKIKDELLESDPQDIHDFPKLAHANAGSGNASELY